MNWEDLTDRQKEVVSATERVVLAFGRAGSGKTTVALWCARNFLTSSEAQSWHRVLFLTFSRTAVKEIARRSGRALGNIRERIEIHTFHSFANRMITAFGRYAGLGRTILSLQSEAEARLIGRSDNHLRYDDLLPFGLQAIREPRVKKLLLRRWPVVICDEFHDTDDTQWELLQELSEVGRLVLFADPNQMIYDSFLGHRGVGPQRVEQARRLAGRIVDLGIGSHRDPTNVIPEMAEAVRQRQFSHPAVERALEEDRLRIHSSVRDDQLIELIRSEIEGARQHGANAIGIFGHTNQAVADLSVELITAGIDHALIGLPEAHGEALATLEKLCLYGLRRADVSEVRARLAVFLTASVRGRDLPPLALSLVGHSSLPEELERRVDAACRALHEGADEGLDSLIRTASRVWPGLGITAGRRPWNQASRSFGAIARQVQIGSGDQEDKFVSELSRRVAEIRAETMLDLDAGITHPIQLMNFHQTKGREADVVILIYRDSDWFGHESEPFTQNSRLLYVSLTRARIRNVVVLPENPHPLVAPFAAVGSSEAA